MSRFIDNSTLSAFARCPEQAILRYWLGWTSLEESQFLQAGSAVHLLLERHLRGESIENALEALHDYMLWSQSELPEGDRLQGTNVHNILCAWLQDHPLDSLPYRVSPEFIEVGFALPLDEYGDIVLTGRFDAAVQARDSNDWYVLDHKTTGRIDPMWVRKFQMDSQMSGYIWALSQMVPSVQGAYVNGIELKKLPSDAKRKCREHGVVYAECGFMHYSSELFYVSRSPEEIEEWKATALDLAEEYFNTTAQVESVADLQKVRLRGMFNGSCAWCEFYHHCLSGRKPELVPLMLRYDPWTPYQIEES